MRFQESRRAYATPVRVEPLHYLFLDNGEIKQKMPTLLEIKNRVAQSIQNLRPDIKRYLNPTPYKVAVTEKLYIFLHAIWLQNAPVGQLD